MNKNLTRQERNLLSHFLLFSTKDGLLPRGLAATAGEKIGVSKRTVWVTWAAVKKQQALSLPVSLTSRKTNERRGKRVELDVDKMKSIPFSKRNTIRNLAHGLGVSKSTIGRWKESGVIRVHTNAIKPTLNFANEIARLRFSVDALTFDREINKPKFKPMTHVVHADEKWFQMSECTVRYYMCPGEEEPHRSCQSKRFVPKIMFICVVTRPRYYANGELEFDGKIGIWPFTKTEPAKRKSRNRPAGTMITKPLEGVNRQVTRAMLLNHVIPAIKSKWPQNASKDIIIQWDNAPPHMHIDDHEFRAAATADGFNIRIVFQPPNSPDTNINDLGFFRSIDTLKTTSRAKTIDELILAVQNAFASLSHRTLNKVFISLQSNMIQIMKAKGKNNFPGYHDGKDTLERMGMLPTDKEVDSQLVKDSIWYLMAHRHANGF